MMEHGYKWTPQPPNRIERIGAVVWTVTMLFAGAPARDFVWPCVNFAVLASS